MTRPAEIDEVGLVDRVAAAPAALRAWWCRHGGLDGLVRVGGAVAVVVTIEALAGYFLWTGMTLQVEVPDAIGWTLQAGLAGGSAVGTRAFHRGRDHDKWWGLSASVLAVLFLVVDASLFALLAHGQIDIRPGTLAVVALVQCLVIGYLTVHTLMAAPRAVASAAPIEDTAPDAAPVEPPADELADEEVDDEVDEDEVEVLDDEQDDTDDEDERTDDDDEDGGRRDADHRLIASAQLTKTQAQAEARRLTAAGFPVTQRGKPLDQLRRDIRDARREAGEGAA